MKTMAIINTNNDSFYSKSRIENIDRILNYIQEAQDYDVDVIDIGAESSRPYSKSMDWKKEIDILYPIVQEIIKSNFNVKISIDTYHYQTAEKMLSLGVDIINDISGLDDINMVKVVSQYQKEVVIMHKKGIPENMQDNVSYNNVIDEVYNYLENQVNIAIKNNIKDENIIVDPGIGFGKQTRHNLLLIKEINKFKKLGKVLLGTSRKSVIGNVLNKEVDDRLVGSLATVSYAYLNNIDYIRVHDYKETIDTIKMLRAIKNA